MKKFKASKNKTVRLGKGLYATFKNGFYETDNPDHAALLAKAKGVSLDDEGASSSETVTTEKLALIKAALEELDHENDEHWTNAGLPDVGAVKDILGDKVSRSEIEEADPDFVRKVDEGSE